MNVGTSLESPNRMMYRRTHGARGVALVDVLIDLDVRVGAAEGAVIDLDQAGRNAARDLPVLERLRLGEIGGGGQNQQLLARAKTNGQIRTDIPGDRGLVQDGAAVNAGGLFERVQRGGRDERVRAAREFELDVD